MSHCSVSCWTKFTWQNYHSECTESFKKSLILDSGRQKVVLIISILSAIITAVASRFYFILNSHITFIRVDHETHIAPRVVWVSCQMIWYCIYTMTTVGIGVTTVLLRSSCFHTYVEYNNENNYTYSNYNLLLPSDRSKWNFFNVTSKPKIYWVRLQFVPWS